jgi:hypothetical protein
MIAVKLSSEMLSKSTSWEENSRVEKRSLPSGGDTLLSGKERSSQWENWESGRNYMRMKHGQGKRMKKKMVVQQEKKYEQKKPEQMS